MQESQCLLLNDKRNDRTLTIHPFLLTGYLIPFHPYPFPRYSRLTPAHFAAAPAVQMRYIYSDNYGHSRSPGGCTCCSPTNRHYPPSPYRERERRLSSERNCRSSHSPEVLPTKRSIEYRPPCSRYDKEFRDYFESTSYSSSDSLRKSKI